MAPLWLNRVDGNIVPLSSTSVSAPSHSHTLPVLAKATVLQTPPPPVLYQSSTLSPSRGRDTASTSGRQHTPFPRVNLVENALLRDYSTWGIGGPAKLLAVVQTAEQLAAVLQHAQETGLPPFILGRGSNCLFDDKGYDGIVILNRIDFCHDLGEGRFYVGSGYAFNHLGALTSRRGWAGLEFAVGIPGTVGGAIYQNAGADGQDTAAVVTSTEAVLGGGHRSGPTSLSGPAPVSLVHLPLDGVTGWGYRSSPLQQLAGGTLAITAATFQLRPCPSARERAAELLARRRKTQPLLARSAGCVFQNPPGESAGALIDAAGLKGLAVGGAVVSQKHANFLVNAGGCTAGDMRALIALVKQRVRDASGFELREEIQYVPYRPTNG